jgi:hypothetical protein
LHSHTLVLRQTLMLMLLYLQLKQVTS